MHSYLRLFVLWPLLVLFLSGFPCSVGAVQTEVDDRPSKQLKLESVTKIWEQAPHNAFTDLIRYQGQWVCAFREAPSHTGGVKDSNIRVLVSSDAETWTSSGSLKDPRGDIRDAKLAITPDGQLMLLTATQLFDSRNQRHQSHAWFTDDLKSWEGPIDVADPDYWTWGIQFHQGVGYSIGYHTVAPRSVRLYTTDKGHRFNTHVADLQVNDTYPNESALVFDQQHVAHCLLRCQGSSQLGTAKPPYTQWTWKETGVSVGGPAMIQLPDGRFLGGGRLYDQKVRTSLFWIDVDGGELQEALQLPSAGDTSYPGMVFHEGKLYVSYYSSHEEKTSIYLAVISVPLGTSSETLRDGTDVENQAIPLENRLEPLVDHYLLDQVAGDATLQLHSPVDREIVFQHDQPWEGNTCCYHTIFHDGQKYRMYYRASHLASMGTGAIGDHPEFTCYAESDDGVHWTRPHLGLFEFQGSNENNIVLANDPATHNFAPFLDTNPAAAPEARFKALGRSPKGLHAYQSEDGIHWNRMQDQAVITEGRFDSLNLAFFDNLKNQYVEYHRDFRNGVRDIKTTRSQDFLQWEKPEWLQYPSALPEHLYTNGIIPYFRAPHVYLGLAKRFVLGRNPTLHPSGGVSDAVFMSSRDGTTFDRWPEAVIRPGLQTSRWVNRSNMPAWGIVPTRSTIPDGPPELSIYTTGDYYAGDSTTLRRHTWRLDGFTSLHASARGGEVITKPFRFTAPNPGPVDEATVDSPADWYEVVNAADQPEELALQLKLPTIVELPQSTSPGKQLTFAAKLRNVPAGTRRLFSSFNGGSPVPEELYFDFDSDGDIGNQVAIRFQYDRYGVKVPSKQIKDWSNDQQEHHLAAVWDDGLIAIYFDGELVGQGGVEGAGNLVSRIGDLRFGEDHPPTSLANEPFRGVVDDILVLKKALTADQVRQLYKQSASEVLDMEVATGWLYTMNSENPVTDQLNADGQQNGRILTTKERWEKQRGETELTLNVSTSAAGSVLVELQDESGRPIPGYTLAECDPIFGDAIDMPVFWKRSSEVSSLAEQPIRMRIVLQDADIYALQFQPRTQPEPDFDVGGEEENR